MDHQWLTATTGLAFLGLALILGRLLLIGRRPAGYPPGPPTLPILGNIHQVSSNEIYILQGTDLDASRFPLKILINSFRSGLKNTAQYILLSSARKL